MKKNPRHCQIVIPGLIGDLTYTVILNFNRYFAKITD